MDPARWRLVTEAFEHVSELEGPERAAALAAIEDREVAAEVERLIRLHDSNSGRFDALRPDFARDAMGLRSLFPGQVAAERFRIVRFLAAGGMGEVYEAFDTHLNERVALKVIKGEPAERAAAIARLKKELQLARRVSHPNVCRVHDIWKFATEGGRETDFFTMEFLDGETLSARIGGGPIPEDEVRAIALQLIDGLAAAHAAGVVHRDLKPGNVILTRGADGHARAVITDFGLSRAAVPLGEAGNSTVSGLAAGTPAYMAPEQIEGSDSGAAADIYALGVVMYEMLTGKLPFDAASPLALAVRKVRDTAKPPSQAGAPANQRWDGLVMRCMAHDAAARFARAEDVGRALRGESVARAASWRIPWRRAAALAAAVTAVALGAWFARSGPASKPEALRRYNEGLAAYRDGTVLRANKLFGLAAQIDPGFAPARAKLAETWLDLDYSDRANQEILAASELARERRWSAADTAQIHAARAAVLRDNARAVELYRTVAEQSVEAGPWIDLGRVRERTDPAAAQSSYERALAADPANGAAHLRLGILAGRAQKIDAALQHFGEAEKAYQASSDYEGSAEALLQRGRALIGNNREPAGRADVERALERARANGNAGQQVQALSQLSVAAIFRGDRAESRRRAEEASKLAADHGLESLAANVFVDLGNTFLTQYQLKEAEANFKEALEIAKRYKLPGREAMASLSLASLATRGDHPEITLAYARPAVEYYRTAGYRRNRALGQAVIVQALLQLRKFDEARSIVDAELADGRTHEDADQVAKWIETRADVESGRGRYPKALADWREAAELRRKAGRRIPEAYARLNVADLLSESGDAGAAREILEGWPGREKLDPAVASRWHVVAARAALHRGDRREAQRLAMAGLASGARGKRATQLRATACAAKAKPGVVPSECAASAAAFDPETRLGFARGLIESGRAAAARSLLAAVLGEARGVHPGYWYRALSLSGQPTGEAETELRRELGEEGFSRYRRRWDIQNK